MPKISVMMPVFNTSKYLGEAIESILNQTFSDFELILLDDCSIDDSYEVCEKYSKKDDRIKLFRNKTNKGLVKTRNIIISKFSNESLYFSPMDSDDIVSNDYLEKLYNYLEENKNISACSGNIYFMSEEGEITGKRKYDISWDKISNTIFRKSPMCHGASLIRLSDFRKIGNNYNEKFARAHDYELWSRFYGNGFKLANLNKYFLSYRIFPNQGKSKHLKLTLWNTIKIQLGLIFKYFKIPSLLGILYLILEILMLFLPSNVVLFLFKKVSKIN